MACRSLLGSYGVPLDCHRLCDYCQIRPQLSANPETAEDLMSRMHNNFIGMMVTAHPHLAAEPRHMEADPITSAW